MGEEGTPPSGYTPSGPDTVTETADPKSTGDDFQNLIPAEYKEEPWVQQVKDINGLFKITKDAKAEVSRRPAGIPHDDASDADWENFGKSFGVPEDPKDYSFEVEGFEPTELDRKFHEALRPALKKAGISKRQLSVLAPEFNRIQQEMVKEAGLVHKASDEEFDARADELFRDRKPAVLEHAKKFLENVLPQSLKLDLATANNTELLRLAAVADHVKKNYETSEGLPPPGGPSSPSSKEALHEEGRKLMGSDAFRNPMDPRHAEVKKKVDEIYVTIAKG